MPRTALVLACLVLGGCASDPLQPAWPALALQDTVAEVPLDSSPLVIDAAGSGAVSAAAPLAPEPEVGHMTFLVGQRKLREGDADDVGIDDPLVYGFEVDSYHASSGDGFEFGFSYSSKDNHFQGTSVEATFMDLYGGYRHTFRADQDGIHPYVGLGIDFLNGDIDVGPVSADDDAWGAYVRAGLNFQFESDVRLGLDYRHVFSSLRIEGESFDGDFDQLALTLGFPF